MWILYLTVGIILFLLLVTAFLVFPAHAKQEMLAPLTGRNFAHRGLHTVDKSVPENSLPAFRAAVEAGYGIELDIQFSKDSQVVVFHDDTLNRVCGADAKVCDYTLEQLRELRLCGSEETIPLFTEVLAVVDGRVPLIVELKNGKRNTELCEAAWAILKEYRGVYCVESFQPMIVRWFQQHCPQIVRGQLSAPAKDFKGELPKIAAWGLSRLLTNVCCRPHFVAYEKNKRAWSAHLCDLLGATRVVWTVHPEDAVAAIEARNDMVIFEFYRP